MSATVSAQQERSMIIAMNLMTIQTYGYVYDLKKGGTSKWKGGMPKRGSPLNCNAAAELLIDMCAADGISGLKKLYYSAGDDGFIVLGDGDLAAFGTNPPELEDKKAKLALWEFSNHYRVRDPQSKIIYDPTFGTFAQNNPTGILWSKPVALSADKKSMISEYGEKYRVTRGAKITIEDIDPKLKKIDAKYLVTDAAFS